MRSSAVVAAELAMVDRSPPSPFRQKPPSAREKLQLYWFDFILLKNEQILLAKQTTKYRLDQSPSPKK